MPSTSAAFGLRPAFHPSGVVRPVAMTIESGYNANILQFQPVLISATGNIQAAGASTPFVGSFMGVEFTDSDGRRRVSNKWIANTTGTDVIAYATSDPYIVYQIQSTAAVDVTNIGNQYDFGSITGGSTVTGLSAATLDVATVSTSGSNTMRLIGITPGPDNAFGDTYVICQVEISDHQFVATRNAF